MPVEDDESQGSEEEPLLGAHRHSYEESISTTTKTPRPYHEEPMWRKPFNYSVQRGVDPEKLSRLQRYRYYQRLAAPMTFIVPEHIIPPEFFHVVPIEKGKKQSSLVTIFSLWNTMLGTSLLCMPSAMMHGGLILGPIVVLLMGALTCYTAILTVSVTMDVQMLEMFRKTPLEFADVIEYYMPYPSAHIATTFGVLSFLGALVVFWILLSNFAYGSGIAIASMLQGTFHFHNVTDHGAVCDNSAPPNVTDLSGGQFSWWSQQGSVPFYLVLILFPLCCLKSATFLSKFNSLGVVCVCYAIFFVCIKGVLWGINVDIHDTMSPLYLDLARVSFTKLSGVLTLSFFIHNAIVSLVRNNADPKKNVRDVSLAFIMATATYGLVGTLFVITFPLNKSCIEDISSGILFDNIATNDILAFLAKASQVLQLITVFPLVNYVLRTQLFLSLFKDPFVSYKHLIVFNVLMVTMCVFIAVVYPRVNVVIRYVGSVSGLAYIFFFPCFVYLLHRYKQNELTWYSAVGHGVIILFGVINLATQPFDFEKYV